MLNGLKFMQDLIPFTLQSSSTNLTKQNNTCFLNTYHMNALTNCSNYNLSNLHGALAITY